MNNLTIATTSYFEDVECNFYNRDDEMFMTSSQLAQALGYAERKRIDNIIARNEYLNEPDFSVTLKLRATDGKYYNTRLFTEDGIYEITMLSDMPKAKIFRAWVRKLIKAYRRGILQAATPDTDALRAAEIISKTTRDNLPYVLQALNQAGLNFETSTTLNLRVVDNNILNSEASVLLSKLNFGLPEYEWRYMTAADISGVLFGGRNRARIVGKIMIETLGYEPKVSGMLRHFRIVRGVKQYFVPLKIS